MARRSQTLARGGWDCRQFVTNPKMLVLLLSTGGSWFLFDYAYYGNTLSLPAILKHVDAHASLEAKLVWTLAIFAVFAVPGYAMAVTRMDRIGHRRLQLLGFAVMAVAFASLGAVPGLTTMVLPFLLVFGLSATSSSSSGPNTTTFVLPSEVFPVSMRTTGHGFASGSRQARRLHRGLPRPSARRSHRPARHAGRGRGGFGLGLHPEPRAARARAADPSRRSRARTTSSRSSPRREAVA